MEINGKQIAQNLLQELSFRVKKLQQKGVIPRLVIILIGKNPVYQSYVRQKRIKGKEIGAKITIKKYHSKITQSKLIKTIEQLNNADNVHGIIVQRPLPPNLDNQAISLAIDPQKDVDGFHPNSQHPTPLAEAVMKILKEISVKSVKVEPRQGGTLTSWLKTKKIVVVGKGETGGGPIITRLKKMGITPQIIDSKTQNPQLITRKADIIISCVGKPKVVRPGMIKRGVILISVGLYKNSNGKLHGDYEEEKIKNIASFYTSTPGGVGPVNVACLLENLVKAAAQL